jgi:hypothetical protein
VGFLAAVVGVQAGNRLGFTAARHVVPAAAAAGVAFGVAYRRFRAVRMFVTALSPSIVLFPALFLFSSSACRILRPSAGEIVSPEIDAATPVVLVVFDEFSLTSLLDEHDRIDAGRFPHLAALAREATWFRNATSVSYVTASAVPAILTGNYPTEKALSTLADHPRNLFTFLGGSYDLRVFESVTSLCPQRLAGTEPTTFGQRWKSLAADLTLVELHLLAPRGWRNRLPTVSQGWTGFGGGCPCCVMGKQEDDRPGQFARFLDSVTASPLTLPSPPTNGGEGRVRGERPTLHFLHSILPHSPFRFLPDGTRYGIDTGLEVLSADGRWPDEDEPVIQAQQRHLLQACYADRLLGQLIARLRTAGLYDRALVIVTADHGISFIPGQPYRHATPATRADILRVPLLVKKPHQTRGGISDRNVQTIDILPTIADVLGAPLPWPAHGVSAFGSTEPAEKVFYDEDGRRVYDRELGRDRAGLARKLAVFDSGSVESLYRVGEHRELIGQAVDHNRIVGEAGSVVEVTDAELFARVNAAEGFVPANVRGTLHLPDTATSPATLAVAINGTIRATCRSYGREGRTARWSALVPASALRNGCNDVSVFLVGDEGLGPPSLHAIALRGGAAVSQTGADSGLAGRDGKPLHIVPRHLAGCVDQLRRADGCLEVAGWSADVKKRELPESILVYVDGRLLYSGRPNTVRADVARSLEDASLERAGFTFSLPLEWFRGRDDTEVRVFAEAHDGAACELSYPQWYTANGRRPLSSSKSTRAER